MRLIGALLTACIALAVAQAAAAALAIMLLIASLYAACTYPRETFSWFALLLVAGLIRFHPLIGIGLVVLLLIAAALRKVS